MRISDWRSDVCSSDLIRGEDHVANTAVQVQLFAALGFAVPCFAHLPLLTDAAGHNLSKRIGSLSLAALREQGIERSEEHTSELQSLMRISYAVFCLK